MSDPIPLYRKIAEDLGGQITAGKLRVRPRYV